MYKHHQESIENMITHYGKNPEITALFLIGSVATGTERPDSDLDCVAVVSPEYFDEKKKSGDEHESCFGKCTYEGGYFDIHYMTRQYMEELAESGSEPMRNMFTNARVLYCHESGLPQIVANIPIFQKEEAIQKQLRFYCTFKQFYSYYWAICKPEGFMKDHVANGMAYNLYRLILIENKILFPSVRKLETFVKNAPNKPSGIVEKCQEFMTNLTDENALALIKSYESWTSFNYPDPKDFQFIANNYFNPLEY
jgi:hypothetical protein